jgi:hypothetical protein
MGIKRPAKIGEKIKVVKEHDHGWRPQPYPLGSTWIVKRVEDENKGLVFCHGNSSGIFAVDYIVLE